MLLCDKVPINIQYEAFLYFFGVFFYFCVGICMVAKIGHNFEALRYEMGHTWIFKISAHSQHV